MSKKIFPLWLIFSVMVFVTGHVSATQATAEALFSDAVNLRAAAETRNPAFVMRSRYVRLNSSVLFDEAGDTRELGTISEIALDLFPNVSYTGVVTEIITDSGATTWIGTLKGVAGGSFYLVATDGAFIAHVASPQGVFEVSSAGGKLYRVIQIDQSKLGEDAPGSLDNPGQFVPKAERETNADSGRVIDVMVVYTGDARAGEGSTAAMKARIALAVAETNAAYADSGVTPRLRLVHTEEVLYTETGDIDTDVDRLTNPRDGYLDAVHILRNTYGADMVSLIVEDGGGYCGVAKAIMATAATAFDVTARPGCMTGYYSFGHEFGHLQGARHDVYVDPTNTPYAYGHGHVHTGSTTDQRWRSIMAYNDRCDNLGYYCTRKQFFSNPTKTYNGAPRGAAGVSEVYRVLNNTAYTVANFRTAVIGSDFSSDFKGSSAGWFGVKGTWSLVSSAYYYTPGLAGYGSSSRHSGTYGDFTFQARMKRAGCLKCANRLIVRGYYSKLSPTYLWEPSYLFQYANDGTFSVHKIDATGAATAFKTWTTSSAIVKNGWNLLKVIAVSNVLKFYINGTLVWAGRDSSYKTGTVGLGIYRDTPSTGNGFWVDNASLQTTPTAADIKQDEAVSQGITLSGGNIDHSP